MATLILICGLPGAGKTTLAKRLETERRALRLTPDDWIHTLLGSEPDQELLDAARDPVESLQWDVATRALELGIDVILDFGFWSRAERDSFKARAEGLGASIELHYCEAPKEVLWQRINARNETLPPGTFRITAEQLDEWWRIFEAPTQEEFTR